MGIGGSKQVVALFSVALLAACHNTKPVQVDAGGGGRGGSGGGGGGVVGGSGGVGGTGGSGGVGGMGGEAGAGGAPDAGPPPETIALRMAWWGGTERAN